MGKVSLFRIIVIFVPYSGGSFKPPPTPVQVIRSEICPIVPFERLVGEPELDEIPEVFQWLEKFPFQ